MVLRNRLISSIIEVDGSTDLTVSSLMEELFSFYQRSPYRRADGNMLVAERDVNINSVLLGLAVTLS